MIIKNNRSSYELAFIGGILLVPSRLDSVDLKIKSSHFYSNICAKIYDELLRSRDLIEISRITLFLEREGFADLCPEGPAFFLKECIGAFDVLRSSIESLASIIVDGWKRRIIANACEDVACTIESLSDSKFDETCSNLISAVEAISTTGETSFRSCAEAVTKALHTIETTRKIGYSGVLGLPTKLTEVDGFLDGLLNGCLYIIGGRTSMGKTSLLLTIAVNVAVFLRERSAKDRLGFVLFVSLEMSEFEIICRMFSSLTDTGLKSIRSGSFDSDHSSMFAKYSSLPISFFSASAKNFEEIINHIRLEARKSNVKAIFVDYLQRMAVGLAGATKNDIIGDVTSRLKSLAQVLDVPVVVASQLSRRSAMEERPPRLADLRDSGNIEQDADVVILLHRPTSSATSIMNDSDIQPNDSGVINNENMSTIELYIAKNRHGATGICRCKFMKNYFRFA